MTSGNKSLCQIAILVGGKGTRLRARMGDKPKPMALLHGRPVLEHQIDLCRRNGFTRIALLAGYRHDVIRDYFGDGSKFGVELTYCIEDEPRGTSGALFDALPVLSERFQVLYGDTYVDFDLRAMLARHEARQSHATLFLHPNDHPSDSDLVSIDADGWVKAIHPYPHPDGLRVRNLVNAALYTFEKSAIFNVLRDVGTADIAKQAIPALLLGGSRVLGYVTPEYIKDMGTPERLDKVAAQIEAGIPECLSSRVMRRAVFLDRDGTLNQHVGHLSSVEQLSLIDGAGKAVRTLNQRGILAIVVTNQPVLARGELDLAGLDEIHASLDHQLGRDGAYLDALYFCPHHPDKGFAGEISELKCICDCRKPETGMIDRAIQELNIDRRSSWMIGDTTSDILAGKRAGLRTVLVKSGEGGADNKFAAAADFTFNSVLEAVDWIATGYSQIAGEVFGVVNAFANAKLLVVHGMSSSPLDCVTSVAEDLFAQIGRNVRVLKVTEGSVLQRAYDEILALRKTPTCLTPTDLPFEPKRTSISKEPVKAIRRDDLVVVVIEGDIENLNLLSGADGVISLSKGDEEAKWRLLVQT